VTLKQLWIINKEDKDMLEYKGFWIYKASIYWEICDSLGNTLKRCFSEEECKKAIDNKEVRYVKDRM